ALHGYKMDNSILSLSIDDQSNMLREEMKQLNDALTQVRVHQQKIAARREELSKIDASDPVNLPAPELIENQLLQHLRTDYVQAKKDLEGTMGSGKGAGHPDVQAARARVETMRNSLLAEVRNIQGSVDRDLAAIGHEASGLSTLFEASKKRALDLNLLEID